MLTIERRRYGLSVAKVYFYAANGDRLPDADVLLLFQSSVPIGRSRSFRTLHVDLAESEDDLLARCSESNRYKIKRAGARDGLRVVQRGDPSGDDLASFVDFYDRFARTKGRKRCNVPELAALRGLGGLRLSHVEGEDGETLCRHAHVADGRRARLLLSASLFRETEDSALRSRIGRANRYLHWRDILGFKEEGLRLYDFGGLALDAADPALRNIAEFKMSFGGTPVVEYHGALGRSLLGALALRVQRAMSGSLGPVEGA